MRTDSERLADMLDAVQRIRRHVGPGGRQRFHEDEVLQSAVLRWFEIIAGPHGGSLTSSAKAISRSRGEKSATCATA